MQPGQRSDAGYRILPEGNIGGEVEGRLVGPADNPDDAGARGVQQFHLALPERLSTNDEPGLVPTHAAGLTSGENGAGELTVSKHREELRLMINE